MPMKQRLQQSSIKSADNSLNGSLRQSSVLHQSLSKFEPRSYLPPSQPAHQTRPLLANKTGSAPQDNERRRSLLRQGDGSSGCGRIAQSSNSLSAFLNNQALGKILEKTVKRPNSSARDNNEEDSLALNNSVALNSTNNSTQFMEEMFPRVLTEIEKSVTLLKRFYDNMLVKKQKKKKPGDGFKRLSYDSANNTSSTRCNNTVLSAVNSSYAHPGAQQCVQGGAANSRKALKGEPRAKLDRGRVKVEDIRKEYRNYFQTDTDDIEELFRFYNNEYSTVLKKREELLSIPAEKAKRGAPEADGFSKENVLKEAPDAFSKERSTASINSRQNLKEIINSPSIAMKYSEQAYDNYSFLENSLRDPCANNMTRGLSGEIQEFEQLSPIKTYRKFFMNSPPNSKSIEEETHKLSMQEEQKPDSRENKVSHQELGIVSSPLQTSSCFYYEDNRPMAENQEHPSSPTNLVSKENFPRLATAVSPVIASKHSNKALYWLKINQQKQKSSRQRLSESGNEVNVLQSSGETVRPCLRSSSTKAQEIISVGPGREFEGHKRNNSSSSMEKMRLSYFFKGLRGDSQTKASVCENQSKEPTKLTELIRMSYENQKANFKAKTLNYSANEEGETKEKGLNKILNRMIANGTGERDLFLKIFKKSSRGNPSQETSRQEMQNGQEKSRTEPKPEGSEEEARPKSGKACEKSLEGICSQGQGPVDASKPNDDLAPPKNTNEGCLLANEAGQGYELKVISGIKQGNSNLRRMSKPPIGLSDRDRISAGLGGQIEMDDFFRKNKYVAADFTARQGKHSGRPEDNKREVLRRSGERDLSQRGLIDELQNFLEDSFSRVKEVSGMNCSNLKLEDEKDFFEGINKEDQRHSAMDLTHDLSLEVKKSELRARDANPKPESPKRTAALQKQAEVNEKRACGDVTSKENIDFASKIQKLRETDKKIRKVLAILENEKLLAKHSGDEARDLEEKIERYSRKRKGIQLKLKKYQNIV